LDRALRLALANNPEVAAVTYDASAAKAQYDVVQGQRWPQLHVVAGYNHYLDRQRLLAPRENGDPGVFSRDLFSGDLVVTMPLYTGGRISGEVEAADLLSKAAEYDVGRTRQELIFNVSRVFYSLLAQQEVISSLLFSQTALQEHLKRVQDLVARQKAARVDVLRTQVRIADVKQQLVQQQNILAVQKRILANLLGVQAETNMELSGALDSAQTAEPNLSQALQQALHRRPDYLAARAVVESQAKAVDVARAAQWPVVSLQGAYGGRWAAETGDRPAGTDRSDDIGRIGILIDVPIFEGGQIKARIRRQRARFRAAQERLRKLELQVRLDVETAVLDIASARQRIAATEASIAQAKESLRVEREKYDLGKGSITNVLDAQAALLASQTNYYGAMADYKVASARLELAMGISK